MKIAFVEDTAFNGRYEEMHKSSIIFFEKINRCFDDCDHVIANPECTVVSNKEWLIKG